MFVSVLAERESKSGDIDSFMGLWHHLWARIPATMAPPGFRTVSLHLFRSNPNWYHLFLVGFSSLCAGLSFGLVLAEAN